jgi:hypothetical protein
LNTFAHALAVSGPDLYAGGDFETAGGKFSYYLARAILTAPTLSISLTATNTAIVSWPSPSTDFTLQQNSNLSTTNWVPPSETVNDNGTVKSIIVNPPLPNRVYRLFKP